MRKTACFPTILFLMLFAAAGNTSAFGGVSGPAKGFVDLSSAPASKDLSATQAVPAGEICPDLASTPEFRVFGIGYIHTLEFVDSIDAVANGTSKHSPSRIPAVWKDVAREWRNHVGSEGASGIQVIPAMAEGFSLTGKETGGVRLGKHDCASSLIYRASLEYRARHGNPKLDLAYPYKVRAAVAQLNEMIAVKREAADKLARRASEVAFRVAMAESLGAGKCQEEELGRVKSGLEEAIHAATDIHFGISETEEIFREVEQASDTLLVQRQYASSRGVPCLSR